MLIPTDKLFLVLLGLYKQIKELIFEALKAKVERFITEEDQFPICLQDKVLDLEEFVRVML